MIKLLGVPYDGNSSFLKGPAYAPPRIRQADKDGSANSFAENMLEIKEGKNYLDLGDLVFNNCTPDKAFAIINRAVAKHIESGEKLVCLGGDHSVTYPIIDAFTGRYDNLNILHLDAHGDLYDNYEGNPYSHASPFARIMEQGKVRSLTQVGIRTLNPHQKAQADKFGVHIIQMQHFNFDFIQKLVSYHGRHIVQIPYRVVFHYVGTHYRYAYALDDSDNIPRGKTAGFVMGYAGRKRRV